MKTYYLKFHLYIDRKDFGEENWYDLLGENIVVKSTSLDEERN